MADFKTYTWSAGNFAYMLPYSDASVEMWALSEDEILCYRMIRTSYDVYREWVVIDIENGRQRYIPYDKSDIIVPPKSKSLMFDAFSYALPDGELVTAYYLRGERKKGFLVCPKEDDYTKLVAKYCREQEIDLRQLYTQYFGK